jgi:protein gp37
VPASIRLLSVEPLLSPIPELNLIGIHWVIVGGESGFRARPMKPTWARQIRDQCETAGIPFFMKQMGSFYMRQMFGRSTKGGEEEDIPADLRIREWPSS